MCLDLKIISFSFLFLFIKLWQLMLILIAFFLTYSFFFFQIPFFFSFHERACHVIYISSIVHGLQLLTSIFFQFLAILNKCSDNVKRLYAEEVQWTVFAPNDTAFANLPPSKRNEILSMTQEESENYVMAFTSKWLVRSLPLFLQNANRKEYC